MKENDVSVRVRYEYEQSPSLQVTYSHGVWGGVNPQGEVEMAFYTESDKLPQFSERFVSTDGSVSVENSHFSDKDRTVIRRINSKLILNYHTARAVYEWLGEKLELLEAEAAEAGIGFEGDTHFQ